MEFLSTRLNEIHAWREEQRKHATTKKQVEAIEAQVLEWRELAERGVSEMIRRGR